MAEEFYTLDSNFLRKEVVNEATSTIWTERFNDPGDLVMKMAATSENISKFAPDTYIAKSNTERVCVVDTQKIKDGELTVSGKDLLGLFEHKGIQGPQAKKYTDFASPQYPEAWIKAAVRIWATELDGFNVGPLYGSVDSRQVGTRPYQMGGYREAIPYLTFGTEEPNSSLETFTIPYGYLLPALQEIAKPRRIGLTLRLASAAPGSYSLKFDYYRGRDLTTAQSTNPPVIFVPNDSLENVEEMRSKSDFKNVALAYAPQLGSLANAVTGIYSSESPHPSGLARKVLMVYAEDITVDDCGNNATTLQNMLDYRAKLELAKHNYLTTVDGEVRPNGPYKYKTDYLLGDKVELRSSFGSSSSAYITEVIYSQDETGEKEYPTLEFT